MRRLLPPVLIALALAALPASASADEQLLTLYSPRVTAQPYEHITHNIPLRPNGKEAPDKPGYVLAFKEMVLVDSKDPNAKPLPIDKMMIHHFLYFAPGRLDQGPGSCWPGVGLVGGRGEEHPSGRFDDWSSRETRDLVGIHNEMPDGSAPRWSLMAMVMNHYGRPKSFYVRTRLYYTTEPRVPLLTTVVGDCRTLANGMSYDVPGGGPKGSRFVDKSTWTVPQGFNGRIVGGASHHHGGAIEHTLSSRTCNRLLLRGRAYYGEDDHPYNTIRPILHEPGPIANGTFRTRQGIPVTEGEVLERRAVHDNSTLHVASMGFWAIQLVRDPSVQRCGPMPTDITEISKPARYDRRKPYVWEREVPQIRKPQGAVIPYSGDILNVGDQWFRPERIRARVGQPVTWRFAGAQPHSVTVANGPRGFSSDYRGRVSGTYSFTPTVPGKYRLTCLVHPTTMSQDLDVSR